GRQRADRQRADRRRAVARPGAPTRAPAGPRADRSPLARHRTPGPSSRSPPSSGVRARRADRRTSPLALSAVLPYPPPPSPRSAPPARVAGCWHLQDRTASMASQYVRAVAEAPRETRDFCGPECPGALRNKYPGTRGLGHLTDEIAGLLGRS